MVQQFVDTHPTTDKGRLTSKFLSQMMMKCMQEVEPEQVAFLQGHKLTPTELDYTLHQNLISINWEELRYQGDNPDEDEAAKRPVEMSPEEQMMSSDVEELSEEMRRETDLESRKNLGKTTLAFIELEGMSVTLQMVFLMLAIVLFGGLGFFFYKELFVGKEDPVKEKRRKFEEKRAKKQN